MIDEGRKKRIEDLRKLRGFDTQEDFAKAAKLSLRTYRNFLEGEKNPNADNLISMADKLAVSTDYLLGLNKHLHTDNAQMIEATGLSDKAIEKLRDLKRMATEYPAKTEEIELPTFKRNPDGSIEQIADPEPITITPLYCDDPRAEASATLDAINVLIETIVINFDTYLTDSALLRIAEYMRADKAVAEELEQLQSNGKPIQLITFRDGLMDKAMDIKELYRVKKKEQVIEALNKVIAITQQDKGMVKKDGQH